MCTVQWYLEHLQCRAIITWFQWLFIYPKENPVSIEHSCSLSPVLPHLVTTNLLSVSRIFLLWVFHINKIIQDVTFWLWFLSHSMFQKSIHIVPFISTLVVFLTKYYFHCMAMTSCLSIHPLVDIWCCWNHSCISIGLNTCFSIPMGIYLGIEMQGQMAIQYLTVWRTAKLFSMTKHHFVFPPPMCKSSYFF